MPPHGLSSGSANCALDHNRPRGQNASCHRLSDRPPLKTATTASSSYWQSLRHWSDSRIP